MAIHAPVDPSPAGIANSHAAGVRKPHIEMIVIHIGPTVSPAPCIAPIKTIAYAKRNSLAAR